MWRSWVVARCTLHRAQKPCIACNARIARIAHIARNACNECNDMQRQLSFNGTACPRTAGPCSLLALRLHVLHAHTPEETRFILVGRLRSVKPAYGPLLATDTNG